jgi:hypothetical protein
MGGCPPPISPRIPPRIYPYHHEPRRRPARHGALPRSAAIPPLGSCRRDRPPAGTAPAGTVVRGTLYVDDFAASMQFLSGSQLIASPYSYRIG